MLPYCEETEAGAVDAEAACGKDADFAVFRDSMEELVAGRAGPLRVRIDLDANGRTAGACAVRGYGGGQWTAQKELASVLMPPPASLPAPACAAGARLELNRASAVREFIEVTERDCARQSTTLWELVNCLDTWQRKRGEIWVFDSRPRHRIFMPTAEASTRRTALLACTQRGPAAGSGFMQPVGIARVGVPLEECMRAEGWNELR